MQDPDSESPASVPSSSTASSSLISPSTLMGPSTSEVITTSAEQAGNADLSSKSPTTRSLEGQVDQGSIVQAVDGSWERLRALVTEINDDQKNQLLTLHFKPASSQTLYSHQVTKQGKTWNVSFQHKWLEQFPWLSYSAVLSGGICRYCILFPEQPVRGSNLGVGSRSGILVLSPYQKPYSKALGKDGVLVCHEQTQMHRHATECDQDIYEAYVMVDGVISEVKSLRNTIDTTFCYCYQEILELAETVGITVFHGRLA